MKCLIIILLTSVILLTQSYADLTPDSPDTTNNNSLHSIQFYLVNGISASYKYNPANNCSWRINFDFSGMVIGEDSKQKTNDKVHQTNNVIDYKREDSWDSQYFESSIQYLHILLNIENIQFYLGAGGLFEYNRSFRYSDYYDYNNNQVVSKSYAENCEYEYGAGIIGIVGLECKIIKRFSIFGEYLPNYIYGRHKSTTDATYYYHENTGNYWRFSVDKFKIGISLNF